MSVMLQTFLQNLFTFIGLDEDRPFLDQMFNQIQVCALGHWRPFKHKCYLSLHPNLCRRLPSECLCTFLHSSFPWPRPVSQFLLAKRSPQHNVGPTMLHYSNGISIQAREFNLCFIRSDNFVSCGLSSRSAVGPFSWRVASNWTLS